VILQEIPSSIFALNAGIPGIDTAWLIDVRDFNDYIYDIKQYLSDEEISRSREIRFENARRVFYLRKGILRIILGSFLNIKPDEIKYGYSANGKPFVFNSGCEGYRFNISHSNEYLFVGLAQNVDIGVDVEKINMERKHSLLAESVFSPEEMALYNGYNEQDRLFSFYKAWVQKEAISKAVGVGISIGFNKFSVDIDPHSNNVQYSMKLDNYKCNCKMNVRFKDDYFLAAATI